MTYSDTQKELNEQNSRIAIELNEIENMSLEGEKSTQNNEKRALKGEINTQKDEKSTENIKKITQNTNKMMNNTNYNDLVMEERPEYKYINGGMELLNNVELISLIINRGCGNTQSIEQARQIVNVCDGSLKEIEKKSMYEMEVVQGIGDRKAIALKAAIELGRRYYRERNNNIKDLGSAMNIYNYMLPRLGNLDHEEAYILLMNQNYKLIKMEKISSGGISETAVDVRMIMKSAIINNATMVALCHNHPSNNITASAEDDRLTQRLKKACDIMRLYLIDHVIITNDNFYSYREQGRI